jgi:spermidine synthase
MAPSPSGSIETVSTDSELPRISTPILLLFIGSGCSALIYEIVWFQLLQLVIGSSAVSLGVLLGSFMGGMCAGSLLFPRLVSARFHPLRVYALLEFGIAAIGLALLYGMPWVNQWYTSYVAHGMAGILFRGLVCAICLLPPTFLMGATLPAIARWLEATPRGMSWLGFFYGANIAGAVFGCLLAGFYLLRVHDMVVATYVAVVINITVATISWILAALVPHRRKTEGPESVVRAVPDAWAVHITIALSGFCALGAEVLWTRRLSLMLGATVYTFSIILAVFLIGLGVGSSLGAWRSRESRYPRFELGLCQLLLTGAIFWSAYMLSASLPYWPIDPSLSTSPWFNFQLDLMRCLWAMFPAALLWGASFPLALASVAQRGQDAGRLVGGIYAANTVGAILGAVLASMVLVTAVGTQNSQRLLIGVSAIGALLMLAPLLWRFRPVVAGSDELPQISFRVGGVMGLLVCGLLVGWISWKVPDVPWGLVAHGRYLPTWQEEDADMIYVGEGMNASIAISDLPNGVRRFHVSGKVVASSERMDMRLQRTLGHLSALYHPQPKSVLVVGCGAAVTAGAFVVHPEVERIVICEIEPLIPPAAERYFGRENFHVLRDPRVEVVYDDARHYILTTRERFDIITSDPIHPWVKGAASLYSREYFELCKSRLNPHGVVTQWVPFYESSPEAVKSEIATFMEAFPHGTIWSNDDAGAGYDTILFGQVEETRIDVDQLQARLDRDDHQGVATSLRSVGFRSAIDLLAIYAGQASDLEEWLRDAEINRDRNLRLQYLAGMGLNLYQSEAIFSDMIRYRRYPENLFIASPKVKLELKVAIERGPLGDDFALDAYSFDLPPYSSDPSDEIEGGEPVADGNDG